MPSRDAHTLSQRSRTRSGPISTDTRSSTGAGAISQVGKNTVIDFSSVDTLTLLNVDASQIDATDFM
jgi:hypothetical protein